ncbi:hypothetical protein BH10ACT7_BH10ACT7_15770 [soil metagenome]
MTPWYLPVARAVPALAIAIVVTFSADHSAPLGFLTFGLYAATAGALITVFAVRSTERGVGRGIRIALGLVTVVAGVVALAIPGAGLPFLVFLITAFAALSGFLELYLGLRERGKNPASRDLVFVGAATALFAIVVLLVPPGFVQSFTGPDGVARELTASVIVVGTMGAYLAIIGVYLVIAGLSLRWAPTPAPAATSLTSEA